MNSIYIISLKSESSSISVVYIAEKTPQYSKVCFQIHRLRLKPLDRSIESINQFNDFVIWSSCGYFEVPVYIEVSCGNIWAVHTGTKPYSLF